MTAALKCGPLAFRVLILGSPVKTPKEVAFEGSETSTRVRTMKNSSIVIFN